jgi:hypothetical protein
MSDDYPVFDPPLSRAHHGESRHIFTVEDRLQGGGVDTPGEQDRDQNGRDSSHHGAS